MWDGVEEPIFSEAQIENITQALGQISGEVPCIEFRAVGTDFKGPHLVFSLMGDDRNPAGSCFSYVGRVQGKNQGKGQLVNLGLPRCLNIGIILHETLHALGAVHEHSRPDRDLFVFILHGNIQPNALHNFRKVTNETHNTRNTPFDPSSLMMYGPNDFGIMDSNGRRTTIKPVKPGVEIRGAEEKMDLSLVDKIELGRAYQPITDRTCFHMKTLEGYGKHVDSLRQSYQKFLPTTTSSMTCNTCVSTGCYHFINGPMNWWQAKTRCEEMNMHLVEIETEEENRALLFELVLKLGDQDQCFWMGLTDRSTGGPFVWNSGREVTYTAWRSGEPNNWKGRDNCGMHCVGHSGEWNDYACNVELGNVGAFCEF